MENIKENKNVSVKTKNLVTAALMVAITCLVTGYILHIPVGNGYVHIGDAIIYLSASILPLPYALVCGAIGAGLADFTTGAFIWVIPTVIIKPLSALFFLSKSDRIITVRNVIAAFLGGVIGTALYMLADGIIFGNMKAAFVLTGIGLIQPVGSFIVYIILGVVLDKVGFKKFYME